MLQEKYLALVHSVSLLAHLSSWLIYDGFCTKYYDSYNDKEHLHDGLLYFDTPIKDYVNS